MNANLKYLDVNKKIDKCEENLLCIMKCHLSLTGLSIAGKEAF
jgi:hypothetical protein